MTDFAQDLLAAHNEVRAKHNAPPLKLSDKLTEHAQKWIDHLVSSGKFKHSTGSGYGENLGMQWGADAPASGFLQQWYSEVDKFDFEDKNDNDYMETGHFSQVVWKGTKELGVGVGVTQKGHRIAVCNYNPSGNLTGAYESNVDAAAQ